MTTGMNPKAFSGTTVQLSGNKKPAQEAGFSVPKARLELATHAFSVHCSTN
jgi:hypothetical protein